MHRIEKMFTGLKKKQEKAFIAYITAGDPDYETTEALLRCLVDSGTDMIELGVPFSDPMADGPTIQAASERALPHPFSLDRILSLVKNLRTRSDIPVILFGYYNPFFHYGLKNLCRDAREAGVDGLLVVDLPPEEAGDLKKEADRNDLDIIFLLAPTSTDERMQRVAKMASGFIYYVSVTGVTGARESLAELLDASVAKIKSYSSLPVGIGFGVSTPEQVKQISQYADGIIVGSAIIKVMEQHTGKPDMLEKVGQFVRSLKEATRG
jgi:tryptophan synthase alpha chain